MKKVAFITSSLANGGAERNIINLSLFLPHGSYKTDIISIINNNEYKDEYGKQLNSLRITTLLKQRKPLSLTQKVFLSLFVIYNLITLIKKNKYNILIAGHEYNTFYYTVLCSKLTGTKSMLIVGNNMNADLRTKALPIRIYHRVCLWISFRLTNSIICVSKGLKNDTQKKFGVPKGKIKVIYNGFNIPKPITPKAHKGIRIITIGRLIKRKGHSHLLKIVKYLNDHEHIDSKLTIIGTGIERNELKKAILRLHLTTAVALVPSAGKKIYKYLNSSDLFVFPSYHEGFGNAIVEAMGCGLPVVSTKCDFGPNEILHGTTYGILTSKLKMESLKNPLLSVEEKLFALTIKKLANNKKLMTHYQNMSLARAKFFSIENMTTGYDKAILELLK